MIFKLKELKEFAKRASKFKPRGYYNSILDYALVEPKKDRVTLTVTDLETIYTEIFEIKGEGKPFLLDMLTLKDVLKTAKTDIKIKEGIIKANDVEVSYDIADIKEYPKIPDIPFPETNIIYKAEILKKLMFKQDKDERIMLYAPTVYLNIKDKEAVRTDGHKLALQKIDCSGDNEFVIIPDSVADILGGRAEIRTNDRKDIMILNRNMKIVVKEYNKVTTYPNYKIVFPKKFDVTIEVSDSIIDKLKTLNAQYVKIVVDNEKGIFLEGLTRATEKTATVEIKGKICKWGDENLKIFEETFHRERLIWILSPVVVKGVPIRMNLVSGERPAVFELVIDNGWKALLMPVRL
jgi:hypothetical protein